MNPNNCLSEKKNQNKPEAGTNFHLQKYVSMAENATGQNLIDIIRQALESPSVHVFGELLDVTNVQRLNGDSSYDPYWKLLNIFAYNTYQDFLKEKKTSPTSLPDLTEQMLTKLRQLTIVSLAKCRRHIPYPELLKELDIDNIRQLEDLIIDMIYANILKGTMDQRNNRLEIDQIISRDVREEDLNHITTFLNEWSHTCENVLATIEQQIINANVYKEDCAKAKSALETKINKVKQNIKSQADNDDSMMTDASVIYMRDAGEKTKRVTCRSVKNSYKTSNNKSWRREN